MALQMDPPPTPGHRRSKTAILKSIVSPQRGHKKSASTHEIDTNPLNSYMHPANLPPQLPPLDTGSLEGAFGALEPPSAPFADEDRKKRMHKKSLSSLSLASFKSKKGASVPGSPVRGSLDIPEKLRDLVSPNRVMQPPSPQKREDERKPAKSRSAIDISILRRKQDKKQPKDNKENMKPTGSPTKPLELGDPIALRGEPGHFRNMNEMGSGTRHRDAGRQSFDLTSGKYERPRSHAPTDYFENAQPTLAQPKGGGSSPKKSRPRPKSSYIPPSISSLVDRSPRKSQDCKRSKNRSPEIPPKDEVRSPANTSGSGRSQQTGGFDLEGIDAAFEVLLESRGVPENMKDRMRALDAHVKQEFIRKHKEMDAPTTTKKEVSSMSLFGRRPRTAGSNSTSKSVGKEEVEPPASPSKRSRPLSRTFGATKEKDGPHNPPGSPTKKHRNDKSLSSAASHILSQFSSASALGSLTPQQWVSWLKEAGNRRNFGPRMFVETDTKSVDFEQHMKDVDIGHLHKLRLVLRNETLRWVDEFLKLGGMESVWKMVERVLGVEWREEHEDNIFHELLLCLKGLATASFGQQKLAELSSTIFPRLLDSLFDEDKKGPAEYNTRGNLVNLLFVYLQAAPASQRPLRARRILSYLTDKKKDAKRPPLECFEMAQINRPYRRWNKEVLNVTKEVFWIFLHGTNIVPILPPTSSSLSYSERNFPAERPPVPAAAHVGGVEWEASSYLAAHLDLLNGCIASLATQQERNDLRGDLKNSGWEKLMGGALRLCKEKLHSAVHEGLKTWVRAANEDYWNVEDVRFGPMINSRPPSPIKRKVNPQEEKPPKLELGIGLGIEGASGKKERTSNFVESWDY